MRRNSGLMTIFVPDLRGGGAERVMLHLAAGLGDNYDVDLLVFRAEGEYMPEARALGVRVVALEATPRSGFRPFLSYISKKKPSLVISALEWPNLWNAMARMLGSGKTKAIVTEHTVPSVYYGTSRRTLLRAYPILARIPYRAVDGVVCVSEGICEDAARTYKLDRSKTRVIYNGVITGRLFGKAKERVTHPFLSKTSHKLVLAVGRLSREKDYPTLLRAFKQVAQELPARLLILGQGPERPAIQKLVLELGLEGLVDMPGFVENPYAFMARADVFVLSSRFEGFGNVLVEAMALGTPVVSTDCPYGPAEILGGGRWGELVPVGDAESLATAILKQLRRPKVPPREAWRRFALDSVLAQWAQYIEEVLNV